MLKLTREKSVAYNEELEGTRQLGTGLDVRDRREGVNVKGRSNRTFLGGAETTWCQSHPVPCKMTRIKGPDHGLGGKMIRNSEV